MNNDDLARLPTEYLWRLHEDIIEVLVEKIDVEKQALEEKLERLRYSTPQSDVLSAQKRSYPKVLPKYNNPRDPRQTWSGRGRQPLWLLRLLKSGLTLDDMIVPQQKPENEKILNRARRRLS